MYSYSYSALDPNFFVNSINYIVQKILMTSSNCQSNSFKFKYLSLLNYLSIYIGLYLSIYLYIHQSDFLSIDHLTHVPINLPIYLSTCLYICLFIYLSIYLSVFFTFYISICISRKSR